MPNPKISVIIPNKNRSALIGETLESLLGQTLSPFEIIVVDDNSSDGFEAIKVLYHNKVKFMVNKGSGPGAGRNTGLEVAKGDFIKFFDSDDVLTNNTLAAQVQVLLDNPDRGLVYSPYVHVKKAGMQWHQQDVVIQAKPIPSNVSLRQCMVRGFFTVIPGMLFRKTFLDTLGPWRTDITAYEDWDYLWRIGALDPNPLHTASCCTFYRMHGEQTTGAHFDDVARDKQKLICFNDALNSVVYGDGTGFGKFDTAILKSQIIATERKLAFAELTADNHKKGNTAASKPKSKGTIASVMALYLRARAKYNRIKTGTNWQVMHGVDSTGATYKSYLAKIN